MLVYRGSRASLASLLGWGGGEGAGQCPWAFHPCSGFRNCCVGYFLKAFAETSPALRITLKTSVASDQDLVTLAPRMVILCTGLKGKIGDNFSELSILWSQHPDFGPPPRASSPQGSGGDSPIPWEADERPCLPCAWNKPAPYSRPVHSALDFPLASRGQHWSPSSLPPFYRRQALPTEAQRL